MYAKHNSILMEHKKYDSISILSHKKCSAEVDKFNHDIFIENDAL